MNRLGLAETYRQYGLFLRSNSLTKSKEHYQREGFLDETIHYNTRYEKALEYFNKSREIFAELKNAEMLTNVYLSMAKTYALMNKVPESCENLDKGRKSYAPLKGLQVETREVGVDDAANYEAYITLMQAQMGCPMEMTAGVALDNRIKWPFFPFEQLLQIIEKRPDRPFCRAFSFFFAMRASSELVPMRRPSRIPLELQDTRSASGNVADPSRPLPMDERTFCSERASDPCVPSPPNPGHLRSRKVSRKPALPGRFPEDQCV